MKICLKGEKTNCIDNWDFILYSIISFLLMIIFSFLLVTPPTGFLFFEIRFCFYTYSSTMLMQSQIELIQKRLFEYQYFNCTHNLMHRELRYIDVTYRPQQFLTQSTFSPPRTIKKLSIRKKINRMVLN